MRAPISFNSPPAAPYWHGLALVLIYCSPVVPLFSPDKAALSPRWVITLALITPGVGGTFLEHPNTLHLAIRGFKSTTAG